MIFIAIKKGLLVSPEFPTTFWGYKYAMPFINKKAAFPPLGLLTFAAYMPDSWEFEMLDLNVHHLSQRKLRRKIGEADAVFVGAMSIQKKGLVELLSGPARGTTTPWILGGPYASTYRDQILHPQTQSDQSLNQGLDLLVWGDAYTWIQAINTFLGEHQRHDPRNLDILIPDVVRNAEPGSRGYLLDRSIFAPLERTIVPRWDLINIKDYRSPMVQTTAGCPFRCDFCDIVQFNGGFSRPKTLQAIYDELQAIFDLGHRGSIFSVDDNFIGNPKSTAEALGVMINFQRKHGYPFEFFTQASVNLGKPELEHLIEMMQIAGFSSVFLGIENPDPVALRKMNKKQNLVDLDETVRKIQRHGIEVYAGFIFGGDSDTVETPRVIVDFVKKLNIFSAMTGSLTPLPHTPLYKRLQDEGRLVRTEYTGNNVDDEIQFLPQNMSPDEMKTGIHQILIELFNGPALYERARGVLRSTPKHIFLGNQPMEPVYFKAAIKSIWLQGIMKLDPDYWKLIFEAVKLDVQNYRQAREQYHQITKIWDPVVQSTKDIKDLILNEPHIQTLQGMLHEAKLYMLRFKPDIDISQVSEYIAGLSEKIPSRQAAIEDLREVYNSARALLQTKMKKFTFPGPNMVEAFILAVKAHHYQKVASSIVSSHINT